jgi:hypothetical protein
MQTKLYVHCTRLVYVLLLLLRLCLQGSMVEYAAYFHSKLVSNTLPGLPLSSSKVAQNIGLLGHSVGAGLATYVAQQAAAQQQPYKSVMYMAPQTQASWLWIVKMFCCEHGLLVLLCLRHARPVLGAAITDSLNVTAMH